MSDNVNDSGNDGRQGPACELPGEAGEPARGRVGRRRFVSTVGAGGLAVAAAIFGRATPAHALMKECCSTPAWFKDNQYKSCLSRASHYFWSCTPSSRRWCGCCEAISFTSGVKSIAGYNCINR